MPSTLAQETFSGICKIVNEWRSRAGLLDTFAEATHETTATGHTFRPSGDILSAGSPLWRKIFCLYDGRWFHRLWVIQEAALAKSVTVIWDDCEIAWEWIGLAAAIIRTNFPRIMRNIQSKNYMQSDPPTRRVPIGVVNAYFIYRLSKSQRYSEPLQFTLHQLLKLTRQFGCKDNRDRVFGLLGLPTTDTVSKSIVPDYSKSTSQVYLEVARKTIESTSSLSLLSSIQRDDYTAHDLMISNYSQTPNPKDRIPSWTPQWQFVLTQSLAPSEPHPRFNASLNHLVQRRNSEDLFKLILREVKVDEVTKTFYPGYFGEAKEVQLSIAVPNYDVSLTAMTSP